MTIKQAAEKYQVSPQAIYQRLKKKHILIESLTDKSTGELTPDGEMVIDKLFDKEKQPFKANSRAYAEEQEKQIKELRIENAKLVEQIKALEERLESTKADKAELAKALDKAQDLHQQTLNRLLPAAGQTVTEADRRKLTWRERFSGRLGSNK